MSIEEAKKQELERLRLELKQAWGDPWEEALKERREEREKEKRKQ
jgi:hypothetical protein